MGETLQKMSTVDSVSRGNVGMCLAVMFARKKKLQCLCLYIILYAKYLFFFFLFNSSNKLLPLESQKTSVLISFYCTSFVCSVLYLLIDFDF